MALTYTANSTIAVLVKPNRHLLTAIYNTLILAQLNSPNILGGLWLSFSDGNPLHLLVSGHGLRFVLPIFPMCQGSGHSLRRFFQYHFQHVFSNIVEVFIWYASRSRPLH